MRALRSGTIDLAVLAQVPPYRPPDAESPPIVTTVLLERAPRVALPADDPLGRLSVVDLEDPFIS